MLREPQRHYKCASADEAAQVHRHPLQCLMERQNPYVGTDLSSLSELRWLLLKVIHFDQTFEG